MGHASFKGLRKAQEKGFSDLPVEVRQGNWPHEGGPQEIESAGSEENYFWLGRVLRRLLGEGRLRAVYWETQTKIRQKWTLI